MCAISLEKSDMFHPKITIDSQLVNNFLKMKFHLKICWFTPILARIFTYFVSETLPWTKMISTNVSWLWWNQWEKPLRNQSEERQKPDFVGIEVRLKDPHWITSNISTPNSSIFSFFFSLSLTAKTFPDLILFRITNNIRENFEEKNYSFLK